MLLEFAIPAERLGLGACLQTEPLSERQAQDVLYDLTEHDALFITEDANYDSVAELVRSFQALPTLLRARLVDVLTSNTALLCGSATHLLEAFDEAGSDAVLQHRSGLRMHVYLLHCIGAQEELNLAKEKQAQQASGARAKPAGKARKGDAVPAPGAPFDWEACRQGVLAALLAVLRLDLKGLFQGLPATEGLVNLVIEMALGALESQEAMKQEALRILAIDLLCLGALRYGRLDFVPAALLQRVRKEDHLPLIVAGVAEFAEKQYNSTQLAIKLVSEFARCSPSDYDAEAANTSSSVKNVAEVLSHLADMCPRVVANQVAVLQPFLGCAAFTVRGALVSTVGSILRHVYQPSGAAAAAGGASMAHLRSKEHLLQLLKARVLDKNAFVRQRVLREWGALVKEQCVPLSWWNDVVAIGVGRLEDESKLVIKAALQMLYNVIVFSPFGQMLETPRIAATLVAAEQQLQEQMAKQEREEKERRQKEQQEDGAEMEVDADGVATDGLQEELRQAEQEQEEEQQEGQHAGAEEHDSRLDNPNQGVIPNDGNIEASRHLIASLKVALDYCRALTASMLPLGQLLAHPAGEVVQETIVLLTLCCSLKVPGAMRALRSMWPLIFSREEGVRAAVVDSWANLYLRQHKPAQQVQQLLLLMEGCTLGELESLGAILAQLTGGSSDRSTAGKAGKAAAREGEEMLSVRATLPLLLKTATACYVTICQAQQQGQGRQEQQGQGQQQQQQQEQQSTGDMDVDTGPTQVPDQYLPGTQDTRLAATTPTQGSTAAGAKAAAAVTAAGQQALVALRHCFTLLSLLARVRPEEVVAHARVIAEIGFSVKVQDAWVTRFACITLQHLGPALLSRPPPDPTAHAKAMAKIHMQLVRTLVAPPTGAAVGEPWGDNWYSVAEAAVGALYALHARPAGLAAAVLKEMACAAALVGAPGVPAPTSGPSGPLARFFFVLGRVAAQQLLLAERLAKAIRQRRAAAERAALEASDRDASAAAAAGRDQKGGTGKGKAAKGAAGAAAAKQQGQQQQGQQGQQGQSEEDDIAAQLGVGSVAADAELDALAAAVEGQICSNVQLIGHYGGLLSRWCHTKAMLAAPVSLQGAALLALSQLMAVDAGLCDVNVALLFTLLHRSMVPPTVRANLVIALADLACRWPNVLEPWTASLYAPLDDEDRSVKRTALAVISHLVLSDAVKAKGHVSKVAKLLVDADEGICQGAHLFFSALSQKSVPGAKGGNPIYNLLPDVLSNLCREPSLSEAEFTTIMGVLLGYVKDKHADAMREKLMLRLGSVTEPREQRCLAGCLLALGYSEKGVRRAMELTKTYKHALGEEQVFAAFSMLVERGRRAADKKGDLRERLDEWVGELLEGKRSALEQREVEEAEAAAEAAAAAGAAAGGGEGDADADATGAAGCQNGNELEDGEVHVGQQGHEQQQQQQQDEDDVTEEEEEEDGIAVMGAQEAEAAMGGTPAPAAAPDSPAPSDSGDAAADVADALAGLSMGAATGSGAASRGRRGRGSAASTGEAKASAAGDRRGRQQRRAVISDSESSSSSSSSSDGEEYEEAMDTSADASTVPMAAAAAAAVVIKQEPVSVGTVVIKQEPGTYPAAARQLQSGARRVSRSSAAAHGGTMGSSKAAAAPAAAVARDRRAAVPATLQEADNSGTDDDDDDDDETEEGSTEMESCEDE